MILSNCTNNDSTLDITKGDAKMRIKKFGLTMGLALISVYLGACSGNTVKESEKATDNVGKCREILEGILEVETDTKVDTTLFYEDEKYKEYFEYLYDTSYDRVDDGAYAYASSAFADEITIVHATNPDDIKVVKGHLEDRIERRIQDFNGYKPEEVEKLDRAVIKTSGNYILMVVADNPEEVAETFIKLTEQEHK